MKDYSALRDRIIVAMLPILEETASQESVADAAKAIGIDVKEYHWETHWPVLAARRAADFADAFISELKRRDSEESPEISPAPVKRVEGLQISLGLPGDSE